MILSGIISILITSVSNDIPSWFTEDETLNEMIKDALPLLGLGVFPLGITAVLWEIIGAQGRYGYTMVVYFSCFVGVVVPFGAVFTFSFNFNLLGLTYAVIIGWTTIGIVLSCIFYCSDWEAIKMEIAEYCEEDQETSCSASDTETSVSDDDDSDSYIIRETI